MDILIEKLEKRDLKEAISIYDNNHNLKTDYEKLLNTYDNIYNNPAYHNIVAKINGEVVGLASIIINFGVKKEYRRQKIGTKMFEYIYDFAKKNDCDFISLIAETENEVAQSFYDSLGYMREVGYVKLVNKKTW